jgi:hypothetical protein
VFFLDNLDIIYLQNMKGLAEELPQYLNPMFNQMIDL